MENEHGGGGTQGRLHGNDTKEGAQAGGGGLRGTAHERISFTASELESGKDMPVEEDAAFFFEAQGREGRQFLELREIELMVISARVVEQADVIESDIEPMGVFFDFFPFAEEDGNAASAGGNLASCLNNTRVASFREDDSFRMATQFIEQGFQQAHGGWECCAGMAWEASFDQQIGQKAPVATGIGRN